MKKRSLRSSRQRHLEFRQAYRERRLDDVGDTGAAARPLECSTGPGGEAAPVDARGRRKKRRQYLREYLRWLWPHRYAVVAVFLLALIAAGLQMIEPLFMRFIIDRVLL